MKKVIALWLILPLVCVALQISGFIFFQTNSQTQFKIDVPLTPKVLGATDFRGEVEKETFTSFEQTAPLDSGDVSAKSFLVFELKTGFVFAQKDTETELSIASLTKLMTALIVYENVDLNEQMLVTNVDTFSIEPSLNIKPGETILISDLFNSMLIGSNNDAAVALANFVSRKTGKNFVESMNAKAEELGMKNSKFSNSMGFDSWRNYSTTEDLRLLVEETQKYAAFVNLGKKTSYSFTSLEGTQYKTAATNRLVAKHPEIQAVKTGYTPTAQGAMISKINFESSEIIFIVLGSKDREGDTLKLKDEVFSKFESR